MSYQYNCNKKCNNFRKNMEREKLSRSIADTTTKADVAWILSPTNFAWGYKWAMRNADLDEIRKLGVTGVKKYWKLISQVK